MRGGAAEQEHAETPDGQRRLGRPEDARSAPGQIDQQHSQPLDADSSFSGQSSRASAKYPEAGAIAGIADRRPAVAFGRSGGHLFARHLKYLQAGLCSSALRRRTAGRQHHADQAQPPSAGRCQGAVRCGQGQGGQVRLGLHQIGCGLRGVVGRSDIGLPGP